MPLYIHHLVLQHGEALDNPENTAVYGFIYDSYNMRSRMARNYYVYNFYKRFLAVFILITLDRYALI